VSATVKAMVMGKAMKMAKDSESQPFARKQEQEAGAGKNRKQQAEGRKQKARYRKTPYQAASLRLCGNSSVSLPIDCPKVAGASASYFVSDSLLPCLSHSEI
jgi:hypothetical protein